MRRQLIRLEKLERLRDIARLHAIREAADALGDLAHATAIARRSEQLDASDSGAGNGAALRDAFRFGAALGQLRADANRSVAAANETAERAQTTLTRRSRERDLVRDKVEEARAISRRLSAEPSPALARSLNSHGGTPTAASRPKRHAP